MKVKPEDDPRLAFFKANGKIEFEDPEGEHILVSLPQVPAPIFYRSSQARSKDPSFLSLGSRGLKAMPFIEGEGMITRLSMANNEIYKIENLLSLARVESLDLSKNLIHKIEGLESMPLLKSLILSQNFITNLEGLELLPLLATLDISDNKLTSLEGVSALPCIDKLMANSNQISSVREVRSLTLRVLEVKFNAIADEFALELLPSLAVVVAEGNPKFPLGQYRLLKKKFNRIFEQKEGDSAELVRLFNSKLAEIDFEPPRPGFIYLNPNNYFGWVRSSPSDADFAIFGDGIFAFFENLDLFSSAEQLSFECVFPQNLNSKIMLGKLPKFKALRSLKLKRNALTSLDQLGFLRFAPGLTRIEISENPLLEFSYLLEFLFSRLPNLKEFNGTLRTHLSSERSRMLFAHYDRLIAQTEKSKKSETVSATTSAEHLAEAKVIVQRLAFKEFVDKNIDATLEKYFAQQRE